MICDVVDDDDDNDGIIDVNDVFPKNAAEWLDTDLDGLGDNEDGMMTEICGLTMMS